MSNLEQKENPGKALFTVFSHLDPEAKEQFINCFAHDVLHTKVLTRPDGTVLIPNEETAKALEEPISEKTRCSSIDDLFEQLSESEKD